VWPAVLDSSITTRDYATIAWGPAITVINDRWWYNANIWGEGNLLYEINNDPDHVDNLAEQHPDICDKLRQLAIKDAGGTIPDLLEKFRNWPGCGLNAWGSEPYGTAARHAKWR